MTAIDERYIKNKVESYGKKKYEFWVENSPETVFLVRGDSFEDALEQALNDEIIETLLRVWNPDECGYNSFTALFRAAVDGEAKNLTWNSWGILLDIGLIDGEEIE